MHPVCSTVYPGEEKEGFMPLPTDGKHCQFCPGFELVSPCPSPKTMTVMPHT